MYKHVKDIPVNVILDELRQISPLPLFDGMVAGQAVSSVIMKLLGKSTNFVLNDIDVFIPEHETNVEWNEHTATAVENKAFHQFLKEFVKKEYEKASHYQMDVEMLPMPEENASIAELLRVAKHHKWDPYRMLAVCGGENNEGFAEPDGGFTVPSEDGITYAEKMRGQLFVSSPIQLPSMEESCSEYNCAIQYGFEIDSIIGVDKTQLIFLQAEIVDVMSGDNNAMADVFYESETGIGQRKAALLRLIHSFDINSIAVGIDIATKQIYYREGFEEYTNTQQITAISSVTPLKTAYRMLKKQQEGLGFVKSESISALMGFAAFIADAMPILALEDDDQNAHVNVSIRYSGDFYEKVMAAQANANILPGVSFSQNEKGSWDVPLIALDDVGKYVYGTLAVILSDNSSRVEVAIGDVEKELVIENSITKLKDTMDSESLIEYHTRKIRDKYTARNKLLALCDARGIQMQWEAVFKQWQTVELPASAAAIDWSSLLHLIVDAEKYNAVRLKKLISLFNEINMGWREAFSMQGLKLKAATEKFNYTLFIEPKRGAVHRAELFALKEWLGQCGMHSEFFTFFGDSDITEWQAQHKRILEMTQVVYAKQSLEAKEVPYGDLESWVAATGLTANRVCGNTENEEALAAFIEKSFVKGLLVKMQLNLEPAFEYAVEQLKNADAKQLEQWKLSTEDVAVISNVKVQELIHSCMLEAESSRMRHCVRTYAGRISSGKCRIVSIAGPSVAESGTAEWVITHEGDKFTVETKQLRGFGNAQVSPMVNTIERMLKNYLLETQAIYS